MFSQTVYFHSENIEDRNFAVANTLVNQTVNIPFFEKEIVSEEYLNELDAIKEEMLNGEFFSLDDVDSFD